MTARFGALDGRTLEFSGGLNIICAPNESGKSTWCAFLRTMLYGLDTSQRSRAGQKPDKVKYRPWSGAPMSGSLEAETADGPVTLRRWTEREDQPMQAFSAAISGTDTPARGLTSENAGEVLTGMSREVFERSVFIRQAGMELENDPELERRINAIVSSGDEDVSYTETEKRLRAWLRLRRSGKRGAIPALQEEIEENRHRLEALREASAAVTGLEEELSALEDRRADAERRMGEARTEQRRQALANLGAVRRSIREAEERLADADAACARAEDALSDSPFAGLEPEAAEEQAGEDLAKMLALRDAALRKPAAARALWLLVPAILALSLSFLLPWRIPLLGIGAALLLLCAALYAHLRRGQLAAARMLEERAAVLRRYGAEAPEELRDVLEEYEALYRDKELAESRLDAAERALSAAKAAQRESEAAVMNELDFVNGDNPAVRAAREAESLRSRIAEIREQRALAEGRVRALGDPLVLESELAEQEQRFAALLRQEEALSLALETLNQADGELQQRLSPRLAEKAAAYFSLLTDGRYDELTLTRDLRARARPAGDAVGWDTDYLSAGAKDQLYLALRLAVCDLALTGGEPCPLVLDDALVTFDGERMARALALLRQIAETRQVLLFTCHRREGDFFADDPGVRKISAGPHTGPEEDRHA